MTADFNKQCLRQIESYVMDAEGIVADMVKAERDAKGTYPGVRRHYAKIRDLYRKSFERRVDAERYIDSKTGDHVQFKLGLDPLMSAYANIWQAVQLARKK